MTREVVYLKVKVVIEYDGKDHRKAGIDAAKRDAVDHAASAGWWSYRFIQATLLKKEKP